jgi:hypothetical protein
MSASDAPSYIFKKKQSKLCATKRRRKSTLLLSFKHYLTSQSIQDSNNTRQAATKCNPNEAGHNNAEDSKKHIKC